ncbi:MAG: cytochrome P450 [Acidimicrobiales bacterium]
MTDAYPPAVPAYDADLFDDDALDDPYGQYQALRSLGPVVWLERHGLYGLPRYADVRHALGVPELFCSGQGVGLNDFINDGGRGTTLMTDGEPHDRMREVIGRPLTPKALANLRGDLQDRADALVSDLVARRSFDAVTDLAEPSPVTWVPDLLGWPDDGRDRLLDWAAANFNALGPLNDRAIKAGPALLEMVAFAEQVAASTDLPAGSMAAGILDAAARGDIEARQCPSLMIDYLAPSLDTTISAIGNAVWLFATHPEQWDRLRREPSRIKNAFNEVLRYESPISCFTRVTTTSTDLAGTRLPAGTRVLMMFASANRDEERWERADTFDITREAAGHLGFGYGPHACAGMGLARLEGQVILSALAERVARFELGPPVRKLNNLIRAFASLPVTVVPA